MEVDEMQMQSNPVSTNSAHQSSQCTHTMETPKSPYTCSTFMSPIRTFNSSIMHLPVSLFMVVLLTLTLLNLSATIVCQANPYIPTTNYLHQQHQQPVNTQQVAAQVVSATSSISGSSSNPYIQTTHEILLDLRQQLLTRALEFDDHFKTLLVNSKRELHNFFRETYGFVYESNAGVFMSMFEGLEQYYANGAGKLTESLESFYVILYQKIFQALNRGREFDASYMRCATERMIYLKPMGEAPEKQIQLLKHTLIAARSLYQALNQTIDIIKSIISIVPTSQCTNLINDKLLKYNHLTIIGSQSGLVSVRQPCMKFCEEVIAKCIGRYNLDELNVNWKAFVNLFQELVTKLTTNYNIQANVQHLDSQISDAVMNFQENGEQVSNEVFKVCGSPKVPQDTHHSQARPFNRIRRGAVMNNLLHSSSSSTRHELVSARDHSNRLRSSSSTDQIRGSNQRQHSPAQQVVSQPSPSASTYSKPAQLIKDLIASDKKLDSNMLLDKIKDYIISTRLIWQKLGNSVCATNNATSESSSSSALATGAGTGSALTGSAINRQANCFQESFAISDLNTDIRYQKEMRQLIHRLNVMQSKLQEALAGEEVDWNSPEAPEPRPLRPVSPQSTSNTGYSSMLRPFSTSSSPPPMDSVDDDSSSEDLEDTEEGSGDGEPIDSTDPDDDYPDETTPAYDTAPDSGSIDDHTGGSGNDLQSPATIPPVIGNDIDTDSITNSDPDAASAQKSSSNSPKLVIPGGHKFLYLLYSCLLALLLVTRYQTFHSSHLTLIMH